MPHQFWTPALATAKSVGFYDIKSLSCFFLHTEMFFIIIFLLAKTLLFLLTKIFHKNLFYWCYYFFFYQAPVSFRLSIVLANKCFPSTLLLLPNINFLLDIYKFYYYNNYLYCYFIWSLQK